MYLLWNLIGPGNIGSENYGLYRYYVQPQKLYNITFFTIYLPLNNVIGHESHGRWCLWRLYCCQSSQRHIFLLNDIYYFLSGFLNV